MAQQVIGAAGLAALEALGAARMVPGYPQARVVGAGLFAEAAAIPALACGAVWKAAFPGTILRPGETIGPLIDAALAKQLAVNWIGLGPGSEVPILSDARFDGKYYIASVSHKYSPGSGGYSSTLTPRRP